MKGIENIRLSLGSTIKEALEIIDSGAMKIALVLDENEKLLGTVSDGDIRRGLLKGLNLKTRVDQILHKNPVVCNVNDSKDDILKLAVDKKIYQIPIVDNAGLLIGIDEVDQLLRPADYSNNVVLMVGGLGARLGELTKERPKPLLNVGNKPLLETIINNFSKHGFRNIIMSVNYKAQMIEDYFGDGSCFGVCIKYIHEKKRMGTAGALSLMRDMLTGPFFVMNGDLLTSVNFEHMLDYHLNSQAIATMGVREYDFQVPYGVLSLDGHKILGIDEKPVHKFFVNGGVYILEEAALELVPDDTFFDMPALFQKVIAIDHLAASFPIREYWLDIGHKEDLKNAQNDFDSLGMD
ncbi:MAG: nucleotidyltransferase family protein [Cycloclasticus sp.]|nr:nucleotidyltransferase family protein [Cycloclasticus sp.]